MHCALEGVSRTCLGPLVARALESRTPGGILTDPVAESTFDRLESGPEHAEAAYRLAVVVRTEIIDESVSEFLARRPGGCVVNLGAGLCTRFFRLDDGHAAWLEVDLPPVIELRRRLLPEDGRRREVPASVLGRAWMGEVPPDRPVLFVLEGLVNYFEEQDVRALLRAIARRFPGAEILIEALGLLYVRIAGNDLYRWGVTADNQPGSWSSRLVQVHAHPVFTRYPERWKEHSHLSVLLLFRREIQTVFDLRVTP